jgi:hypothetical protein
MVAKAKDGLASMCTNLFSNFLPEKIRGLPSRNFDIKKLIYFEKDDEITRFDGIQFNSLIKPY